ncbi:MAG: hypothetical protein U1F43_14725 [Myxococcota bacterium]
MMPRVDRDSQLVIQGKRVGRRGWMIVGLLALVAGLASIGILLAVLKSGAEAYLPWTVMGGIIAWWVCFIIASIPRKAELRLEYGRLHASWRARPIACDVGAPRGLGAWSGALDAPVGVALWLGDRGERPLRLGGRDHDGRGLALERPPTRRVDFEMSRADLDRLLAALGVTVDRRAVPVVQLLRSSQAPGGLVRMIGPWLVTLAVVAVGGVVLGLTGLGDQLQATPSGQVGLAVATTGLVLGGMAWQIASGIRVKKAQLALRLDERELTLLGKDGATLASAAWHAVTAERFNHRLRVRGGTWLMPALRLAIGDHPPLRVGVWDPSLAWPPDAPKERRGATWLAGAPQWRTLVTQLELHHVLD